MSDETENLNVVGWVVGLGIAVAMIVAAGAAVLANNVGAPGAGGKALAAPSAPIAPAAPAPAALAASAAAPAPVTAQVFFASGQTGLPADLAATLQPVIEAARARPSTRLAISGFHDRTGNPEMNAEIAKQRAFAIRDALTVAGVDVSRIELRKPQDMVGGTDDALARRVEVTLQ